MGEETFSGLGSKLFLFRPDDGKTVEINLETNVSNVIRKSEQERRIDRIMATPPSEMIVPTDNGFEVIPTGFSASFTCDLPDSAEFDALRDKLLGVDMPESLRFDVHVIPSNHRARRFSDGSHLPRRLKKAMRRGGYYKRNTRWKRKAVSLAKRDERQSEPYTIKDASIGTNDQGEVLILGRGVSKTQLLRQRRSRQL